MSKWKFYKMTRKQHKEYTRRVGKYLGYPKCCIEDFVKRGDKGWKAATKEQKKVINRKRTGFIPCHQCAIRVIMKETTILGLLKNRKHRSPFPYVDIGAFDNFCDRAVKEVVTHK
jgi:hypothetical protein